MPTFTRREVRVDMNQASVGEMNVHNGTAPRVQTSTRKGTDLMLVTISPFERPCYSIMTHRSRPHVAARTVDWGANISRLGCRYVSHSK